MTELKEGKGMDEPIVDGLPGSQSRGGGGPEGGNGGIGEGEKTYIVRHNESDVRLTLGELIENAEKGLDYDRIRPSHDFVEELAAKDGESDAANYIKKVKDREGSTTAPDESEKGLIAEEYPEYVRNGAVELPAEVLSLRREGMDLLSACRVADLHRTKKLCEKLSAKLDAILSNGANAAASVGSLSGTEAPQNDYCTSKEWDRLPQNDKERFIRNGKIYEFMRKWSGKQ